MSPGAFARPKAASAPRVLVVEDDSDLAHLLAYNLEAEGYVVKSVERGDEAEHALAENAHDLVILDWMEYAEIDDRTVDVYVGRLRKALSKGRERDPIRTVRGVGYAFDERFGKPK
jgi:DNA-binding response OmpR family regulator